MQNPGRFAGVIVLRVPGVARCFMAGLVPAIPIRRQCRATLSGIAGTSPAMTGEVVLVLLEFVSVPAFAGINSSGDPEQRAQSVRPLDSRLRGNERLRA